MSVHVHAEFGLELVIDLYAVGKVGIELNHRCNAVCDLSKVCYEGRICKAVGLCNDHFGAVVLSL